ncbi:site-specific integrase [Desulfobacula sp.]|uniref:tyrosine-type recombinase/integrase n=1 Tax=Desulfobacula sp. TaxID=2593537 RepID=UPI00260E897B|nr:site-specific integrase [Desulfobacula sp.]
MTELRQKFERHLTLHRLSPKTNAAYMNAVKSLAGYHRQSPDKLTNEQIQDYLHYIIADRKLAWSSCNVQFSGIKRFYKNVLNRKTKLFIPPRPREKKIFMALSREEVDRILNACQNLKHYTLLLTVYSAGLRVSEVVKLQPIHIERSRKMIRIEQGKGRKDRYTVLSDTLLKTLEEYWRAYRPGNWIFFGKTKTKPMPIETAQKIYYNAKEEAGVKRGKGIHTLRHCFATHLLEQGTRTYILQQMLGHKSIKTTARYLHISNDAISKVISPVDAVLQ